VLPGLSHLNRCRIETPWLYGCEYEFREDKDFLVVEDFFGMQVLMCWRI